MAIKAQLLMHSMIMISSLKRTLLYKPANVFSLSSNISVRYSDNTDILKVRIKKLDSLFLRNRIITALFQIIYSSCLILYIFHINRYQAKSNVIHNSYIYSICNYAILINKFPYIGYLLQNVLFINIFKYICKSSFVL